MLVFDRDHTFDDVENGRSTFNANTVLPSLSLHRVTAPPAPSPRLPSSSIFFCSLAACQPSSSKSSTSRGRPFSKLSLSRSGSSPFTPFSPSNCEPPSRSEYTEPMADEGSELPLPGWRRLMAKLRAEYWEFADAGSLPLPCEPVCPFTPSPFVANPNDGRPAGLTVVSCGTFWLLPMGVASCRRGGAGRVVWRGCGCGCIEGCEASAVAPLLSTGLALGEGGIPRVSLGARGLPALLRLPGTGGRRSGTEEEDMARLFCLSPGKNNSLGSARVATVSIGPRPPSRGRPGEIRERERER
jgi:hypothetical protein